VGEILVENQGQRSDLSSLLAHARRLGLRAVLEAALGDLPARGELRDAIAYLLQEGVGTVAELDSRDGQAALAAMPARSRRQLGAAVASLMAGAAAQPSQAPPSSQELERWAAEHGVAGLLDTRLAVLDRDVEWTDRRWLYQAAAGMNTLRSLFKEGWDGGVRYGPRPTGAAVRRLQQVARAYLARCAERVRAAVDEERELLARPPPGDPTLRALAERLLATRAEIRARVQPRARAAIPRRSFTFDLDPPALLAREEDWPHSVQTLLPLAAEPIAPACGCTSSVPALCAHALAAIDALLDKLGDPAASAELAPLAAELGRPAWSRLLAELDRLVPDGATAPSVRLVWRLRCEDDRLSIAPVQQRLTRTGKFTRGSPIPLARVVHEGLAGASPVDAQVAELLSLAHAMAASERARHYERRAIEALVGHPRVVEDRPPHRSIDVRAATLELVAAEDGDTLALRPRLEGRELDARRLIDPRAGTLRPWLVDEAGPTVTVLRATAEIAAAVASVARHGGCFPAEAMPALVERLPALGARLGLALPPSLRGEEIAADPRPLLRLDPGEGVALRARALVRPLAGASAHPPGAGPVEIDGLVDGRRVFVRRDLAAEPARVRAALEPLPLGSELEPFAWTLDGEPAIELLAALAAQESVAVEWAGPERRVSRAATAADLRVRLDDRRDWFGLAGEIAVDGAVVPLRDLLEAVRAKRGWVAADGGLLVRLGAELRARLAAASRVVYDGRAGLEIAPLAAAALDELVDQAPARFRDMVARIRAAGASVPEPPAELAGVLRPYQLEGFRWMARLASWAGGACLADDMGLGKTVQALALLGARAALGPALVVAPTSVAANWIREASRFAPGLRTVPYREDRAGALASLGPGDVVVTSYGLVARDAEELGAVRFATLVLDEAQAIKNPGTQRARAVLGLAADFRLALTGTPVENRLAELWSLFRALVPGLLASWERFRDRFAGPIERDGDPDARAALARVVRPFILRRLKSEVARELPARTEVQVEVTLSPPERELYERLRRSVAAELLASDDLAPERRRFQVLAALTRLRQLACHPRLCDATSTVPSAKLARCLELVDELREGDHRALVFSQFTAHLALLREALDAAGVPYLYLDGATPAARRQELVDAFQAGEGEVFLISLRAGGTGLNLTAADYVIHLDPWWNPAVEDQATDRAHRIGQERPVTVYRLVTQGTVEEAILALHGEKRRLVSDILDGTGAAATVSTEELCALLGEL
jgi:superfamily II DNA or RNA helicase